jgi:leucyl-tRNA synthetase
MMEKPKYDHRRIEAKWQKYWEDRKTFQTKIDWNKPKYYVLDMFPYPSGAGLHVGHVTGYTATDILARYKRQKGFNVLHPMGWDSFGLPAEQYAIRTGTHPAITTQKNIDTYRRQLKSLGFSYDWDRELATSDETYYKWTQWIFTKLYEKGLAYEATALVNFCPALGTVLANEEVDNGKSKEGGYPIERRPLRQWILRITAYADRLIQDLDLIDWPDSLKKLQIHWIGRSVGAKVHFTETKTGELITIFTTCPDTLFGATFLVLSPEHPLIDQIVDDDYKESVQKYQKEAASKSDLERTDLAKEKSGVFTGAYAKNPVNGKEIPIWIADYVLMGYGTGAIMAVPAHDERDFEFAKKFDLPIVVVIEPDVSSHSESVPEGKTESEVYEEIMAGDRCWPFDGKIIHSPLINGLGNQEAKKTITAWLAQNGFGEESINYRLRDWLFSRQRYWGEPFPILHFEDGTKRVLDIDELPLVPPSITDYKPSGNGQSPLAKVREWVEIVDPITGKKAMRETNTMPQWAGSCWYYLRFTDPCNSNEAWSHEAERYWLPVDLYVGGVEHAVLHLLYARFWHKVLYDCGLVSSAEPFQMLRNQGLVHANSYRLPQGGYVSPEEVVEKDGRYYQMGTDVELDMQIDKMSKSKLNGVTPDEMIEDYGADALRLYEMFMGPFEKEKIWNTDAVTGCKRFLNRFFDLIFSDKAVDEEEPQAMKLAHRLVHGVERDIEAMQFNTAIAKMMEFMNAFQPLPVYPRQALRMLTLALASFAPHIAEEAWEHLGGQATLACEPFPQADPAFLYDDMALIVVQVNGKMRGKWMLPKNKNQEEILSFVSEQPQIVKHITGRVDKVIWVPGKLLNLVVADA